jgi:L-lactate dehydrogenase complex protein LldG
MTASAREQILARIRAATRAPGGAATAAPGGTATPVPGSTATAAPGSTATGRADRAPDGTAADASSGTAAGIPAGTASHYAAAAYAALPRAYLRAHHDPACCDIVDLFAERAADYRAVVERVAVSGLASAVTRVLAARAAAARAAATAAPAAAPAVRFAVPGGLPAEWIAGLPAGTALVSDVPPLSAAELDQMAGVVTGCAVAIAETGTIILDHGPGQGRRALTLVPDFHLVVVRADQVAADLADALARLDPSRPHTLISGPSATSDIELIRVEGVHGPRTLHVLLAG